MSNWLDDLMNKGQMPLGAGEHPYGCPCVHCRLGAHMPPPRDIYEPQREAIRSALDSHQWSYGIHPTTSACTECGATWAEVMGTKRRCYPETIDVPHEVVEP